MKIFIQCEYTLIRYERFASESTQDWSFHYTHSSGRMTEMIISYSSKKIIATMKELNWCSKIVEELRLLDEYDGNKLSQNAKKEIAAPLNEIRSAVGDLLALLKYHLRHYDLKERSFSIKSEKWGDENLEMYDIPTKINMLLNATSVQPLNKESHKAVQQAITSGVFPLVAMRHLHRAKHESEPHHKWIDATIAAELAIKEVLSRANPNIAPILLDLPSPPFSKLYGSLLKAYLGQESPFRNKLIKGQEKRNILVHKPGAISIDQKDAEDYVRDVESAIFHLLSLLYPKDELIKQAYYRTQMNFEIEF